MNNVNINKIELDNITNNIIANSIDSINKHLFNDISKYKGSNVLNIIVVDDEAVIRHAQTNIINKFTKSSFNLNKLKINVLECQDGLDCLNTLYKCNSKRIQIHGILTDESMNFINGTHLIKIIKQIVSESKLTEMKLFLSSSDSTNNNLNLFNGIYIKPINESNAKSMIDICERRN